MTKGHPSLKVRSANFQVFTVFKALYRKLIHSITNSFIRTNMKEVVHVNHKRILMTMGSPPLDARNALCKVCWAHIFFGFDKHERVNNHRL